MDRFSETSPATFRESEYNSLYSAAVNVCFNCRQSTEQLVYVPGFDYMGCPECADEAALVISAEDANGEPLCPVAYGLLIEANGLRAMEAALKAHQGTACVHCESQRKTVVSDRLVLGDVDATCCGEVA